MKRIQQKKYSYSENASLSNSANKKTFHFWQDISDMLRKFLNRQFRSKLELPVHCIATLKIWQILFTLSKIIISDWKINQDPTQELQNIEVKIIAKISDVYGTSQKNKKNKIKSRLDELKIQRRDETVQNCFCQWS